MMEKYTFSTQNMDNYYFKVLPISRFNGTSFEAEDFLRLNLKLYRSFYRWQTSAYSSTCSHECGGGQNLRQVVCVRDNPSTRDVIRVSDSECLAIGLSKPGESRLCNQFSCEPEWKTGVWSSVSEKKL